MRLKLFPGLSLCSFAAICLVVKPLLWSKLAYQKGNHFPYVHKEKRLVFASPNMKILQDHHSKQDNLLIKEPLDAWSSTGAQTGIYRAPEMTLSVEETCQKVEAYLETMEKHKIIFNCTSTIQECIASNQWYSVNKYYRNKAGFWAPNVHPKKLWVKAWTGEFGAEMDLLMPWAYTLHRCNLLHQTHGCGKLQVFYFFSPQHVEIAPCKRWSIPKGFMGIRIDYQSKVQTAKYAGQIDIDSQPSASLWPPPLAHHCRSIDSRPSVIQSAAGSPLLIIANKFAREFDGPPRVFYPVSAVEAMINIFNEMCSGGNIVYYRARAGQTRGMVDDGGNERDLLHVDTGKSDFETVRGHSNVIVLNDLFANHTEADANELQCRVFARAQCFLSVQGGIQHILRYFGGKQMIFHPPGYGYETYSDSESAVGGATYYANNSVHNIVESMRSFLSPTGRCECGWLENN